MSEFEEGKIAFFGRDGESGLMGKLDLIKIGEANFEAEMKASFDNFKSELPDSMKPKFTDLKFEEGDWKLISDSKDEINLTEVKNKINSGEFESAFEDLQFNTKTPEAKRFFATEGINYGKSLPVQAEKALKDSQAFAKKLNVPEPKNIDELRKICKDQGWNIEIEEKKFNDAKNSPDKGKQYVEDKWEKMGGYVKKFLINLALFYALYLVAENLYDWIKGVQHSLSGCFSTTNNQSCKIYALTCNDDDINPNGQSVNLCSSCQKLDCSDIKAGQGMWLPMLLNSCTCDSTGKSNFPGIYCPDAPTGTNDCAGKNPYCPLKKNIENYNSFMYSTNNMKPSFVNDTLDLKLDPTDCQNAKVACPFANGCISRKEACADSQGEDCSKWCNSDTIRTLSGMTIKCQKCSFWCAFNQIFGDTFGLPSLSKIIKILIYIAIGIAIAVLAFVIIKALITRAFKSKGKENSGIPTLNIKVSHD